MQAQGITKEGGRFAAQKAALARAFASDAVARELNDRPDQADLAHAGILEQSQVAPSLASVAKALNKQLITNQLNHKLYTRESAEALEQERRALFPATEVAPRLRQAKVALEHAITRDRVGAKLEIRPDAAQLLHSGILNSPVSARIAGTQRALQKHYTKDLIGHLLEQRSAIETLEKDGVLMDVRIAPSLQGTQKRLEHALAKSNLYHALQARPTVQQLAEKNIWRPNPRANYYESDSENDDYEYYAQSQPLLSPSSAANRAANASYAQNPAQSPNSTASIAGIAAAEAAYQYYKQQAGLQDQYQQQSYDTPSYDAAAQYAYEQSAYSAPSASASRRSKNFHLTRILLKFVAAMSETGELSAAEKSLLKELIVDQVPDVYEAAEYFDRDNDLFAFKSALRDFAQRR